jgi:hypothetical protein
MADFTYSKTSKRNKNNLIEIKNRPGLSKIDYRIGNYNSILKEIFSELDNHPLLKNWTYRNADDPGIALLEGTSILCEILAFYQDLYANEAFLRSAKWKESISKLVRLTGYHLTPGNAGKATFAFEIKGDKAAIIPKDFSIKTQLENDSNTAYFETSEDLIAFPESNAIQLYIPLKTQNSTSNIDSFYIFKGDSQDLQPDDRLLIFTSSLSQDVEAHEISELDEVKILIIKSIEEAHDRILINLTSSIKLSDAIYYAYKIGRTFHHFGYNSPPVIIRDDESIFVNYNRSLTENTGKIISSNQPHLIYPFFPGIHVKSEAARKVDEDVDLKQSEKNEKDHGLKHGEKLIDEKKETSTISPIISSDKFPLEVSVDDIVQGTQIIIQFEDNDDINYRRKKISDVNTFTYTWGDLTSSCTVVHLPSDLKQTNNEIDIRTIQIHEVLSNCLELRRGVEKIDNPKEFLVFGNEDTFNKLNNRPLVLFHPNLEPVFFSSQFTQLLEDDFYENKSNCRLLSLNQEIQFDDQEYPYYKPISFQRVEYEIYGNIMSATQGKIEKETILGNGNSRMVFQTFKLPKSPLSYLLSNGKLNPKIEIYVNDVLWTYVTSFFGCKPTDEVYVIRQDDKGESWIQFGDGKTGAKLPSGIGNVRAIYRTGIGAIGSQKEDSSPKAANKMPDIQKIHLLSQISLGAVPETGNHAQGAAPHKVQSLNRLVSLEDYENEVLILPGVLKAKAEWAPSWDSSFSYKFTPKIVITALLETNYGYSDIEKEFMTKEQFFGAQRHLIEILEGKFKYIYIHGHYSKNSQIQIEDIETNIKKVLGVANSNGMDEIENDGLFTLNNRQFGKCEYLTRIEGVIQNVEGVKWIKIDYLGYYTGSTTGSDFDIPTPPDILNRDASPDWLIEETSIRKRINCENTEILRLHRTHLELIQME